MLKTDYALNSVEMTRLLQAVLGYLPAAPAGSLQAQTTADLRRVVARLERTAMESHCPTCGSSFYNFEERSI